ncbi:myb-like protein U [Photinus pyralis]|uniref:myb-like protein U n=1 Tax=Photinus pyralis TaxID=7054 RepID=UPI0012677120|nr:myb-like protein U [Photinus pyralis]
MVRPGCSAPRPSGPKQPAPRPPNPPQQKQPKTKTQLPKPPQHKPSQLPLPRTPPPTQLPPNPASYSTTLRKAPTPPPPPAQYTEYTDQQLHPATHNPPTPPLTQSAKRTRTISTSSSGSAMSHHSITQTTTYRYCIRNILTAITSQKQLYNSILTFNLPLTNLKFNHNQSALIETKLPVAFDLSKKLQHLFGDPNVSFTQLSGPKPQTHTPKPPSFSCVIRNVDRDITESEILQAINLPRITRALRIISRATNLPTTFVRIITTSKSTLEHLLQHGICMFSRHYPCEPSHIPDPTPKYCSLCTKIGHLSSECTTRVQICPSCGENHKPNMCKPDTQPKCNNCSGPHPTYSFECTKRKEIPSTPAEAAPPKPADTQSVSSESSALPETAYYLRQTDFLRTIALTFIHLFPDRRSEVIQAIDQASQAFLNRRTWASFSGNVVAFSTPYIVIS